MLGDEPADGPDEPGVIAPEVGTAVGQTLQRVSFGFLVRYGLAQVGTVVLTATPMIASLALQVSDVVPQTERAGALSIVVSAGAFVSLFGYAIFGRLSDRTRSRWGMRRPWIVAGLVVLAVASLIMAQSASLPALVIGYCVFNVGLSSLMGAMTAVLPDQVPLGQRGLVSGVLGIATPFGTVGGAAIVALAQGNSYVMFFGPYLFAVATVAIFALKLPDRRLDDEPLPPMSVKTLLGSLWINPFKHADFGYAWAGRFLFGLATSFTTTYMVFYLQDQHGMSETESTSTLAVAVAVLSFVSVFSSLGGGWASDRLRRRKIFVLMAAAVYGVGMIVLASTTNLGVFFVAIVIAGLGMGAYLAVDLALVADVLPNPEDSAKDMGVFHMAITLPQTLAPVVASVVLTLSGQSYPAVYIVAGLCGAASAAITLRIRAVR